ncbi:MAG: tRNA (adenosine(37)-N6)-dimethylallyltransferase MiaA [Candidatus Saccharibacteria bacterium]
MTNKSKPLVVIVGPTASGKTSLAVRLAKKFNGEIICADSRSIYKGMDIGTAKATTEEMCGIPHWGLDLVEPGDYFTAFDFKIYAEDKIDDIRSRGKVPFLVGGTGLYVDAIIFEYQFGKEVDVDKRTTLDNMTVLQLQDYCNKNGIQLPENYKNKRYLIRSIEKRDSPVSKNDHPIKNTIIVGLTTSKDELLGRINIRINQMLQNDVVEEAKFLGEKYGWNSEALKSNAYKVIKQYLDGLIKFDEIKPKNSTLDWRLAKRQMTWLRRNKFIKWFNIEQAEEYISSQLAKLG